MEACAGYILKWCVRRLTDVRKSFHRTPDLSGIISNPPWSIKKINPLAPLLCSHCCQGSLNSPEKQKKERKKEKSFHNKLLQPKKTAVVFTGKWVPSCLTWGETWCTKVNKTSASFAVAPKRFCISLARDSKCSSKYRLCLYMRGPGKQRACWYLWQQPWHVYCVEINVWNESHAWTPLISESITRSLPAPSDKAICSGPYSQLILSEPEQLLLIPTIVETAHSKSDQMMRQD